MSLYSINFSPTGRTQQVCNILAEGLGEEAVTVDLCGQDFRGGAFRFTEQDICLIAAPVYKGRIPAPAAERIGMLAGNGARAVIIACFGNRDFDDALVELYDVSLAAGFRPAAAITAITEHCVVREIGAGRPDASDAAALKSFADEIGRAISDPEFKVLTPDLPGNRPYVEPEVKHYGFQLSEDCTGCGLCASRCPTGAIDPADPSKIDLDRCIDCIRCLDECPSHARIFPSEKKEFMRTLLTKVASERKENRLYL